MEETTKDSLLAEMLETIKATKIGMQSRLTGKECIVRTYSAGVFYGNLEIRSEDGKQCRLLNARRVWRWEGAASLSQLSIDGSSKPSDCKFPAAVEFVELTECIEYLPLTDKAKKSLDSVPVWKE